MKISHLQFADDTLLFLNGKVQNLHSLKALLQMFSRASGQLINCDIPMLPSRHGKPFCSGGAPKRTEKTALL